MMKVLKITAKNLKLLMRSKTSMFVTIFGPLIIMLLVGFAFNNPSASKLNIGYYSPEKAELTQSFILALSSNQGFAVTEYPTADTCKEMIEQGKSHICIVFPNDFELSNNQSNEVIFYVDQSRANFVYAVLDAVSDKVDLTSSQLSTQLTNDLLSTLAFAQKTNNENIAKIVLIKSDIDALNLGMGDIKGKLDNLDFSTVSLDDESMLSAIDKIRADANALKNAGMDAVEEYGQSSDANSSIVDELTSDINVTHNRTIKNIDALDSVLETLQSDIDNVNLRLSEAKQTTTGSADEIIKLQSELASIKTDVDSVKSMIEKINSQINALRVTSAESIVNPINTRVEPITAKSNNLNFIFPYLVILMIVFISIMLSSTIIIIEKTSKAYFRNFTTPTNDFTFILSVFLTSFFVIILQLILVLVLAYYFLNTTILTNVSLTLLTLLVSIIVFIFLGMIIGYLFNSQEAVTMASISVGSVLLFLSNLVLPLETMSDTVQELARYNPYVVASELLKKVTLFNSEWNVIRADFIVVGVFMAVFFIMTLIIQKMSKIQYISKKPIAKQIVKRKKEEIIDKYFKLKTGVLVRDGKELLKELKIMSDITFEEYVDKTRNDFEGWLTLIGNNELAKAISKCRTREEMIVVIEQYFKKIK